MGWFKGSKSSKSASSPGTPAGWYPDNVDPSRVRYWDGTAWTEHVADAILSGEPTIATTPGGEGRHASSPAGTHKGDTSQGKDAGILGRLVPPWSERLS